MSIKDEKGEDFMLLDLSRTLKRMGFSASLQGYKYSMFAIMLAIQRPEYLQQVTTLLYPAIAKHFNVTSTSVERCIRNAIEVAWLRGDIEFTNDLFQYSINAERGKPTNAEFISVITEYFLFKYEMDTHFNEFYGI